jgi:hypothetical protein
MDILPSEGVEEADRERFSIKRDKCTEVVDLAIQANGLTRYARTRPWVYAWLAQQNVGELFGASCSGTFHLEPPNEWRQVFRNTTY